MIKLNFFKAEALEVFSGLWFHINKKTKLKLYLLLLLMIISGIAEIASLASVIPFLSIISNPDKVLSSSILSKIFDLLNLQSSQSFLYLISLLFILSIIISGSIRTLTIWFNSFLAAELGTKISVKAYHNYLYQPYSFHIAKNSSQVIVAINNFTGTTINIIYQTLTLISSSIFTVFIISTLVFVNPYITFICFFTITLIYLLISILSKNKLKINSRKAVIASESMMSSIQRGLGAIRDIQLSSTQEVYVRNYRNIVAPLRLLQAETKFITLFPRYFIESLSIILIVVFSVFLFNSKSNQEGIIPLLGLFALGIQKLLPTFQQIYGSFSTIRGNLDAVKYIVSMLDLPINYKTTPIKNNDFNLKNNIIFKNVSYRYKNTNKNIITNLDLTINKGDKIGIIGETGSGKTTLIDLLMGLLSPTSGSILIDNINISSQKEKLSLLKWRSSIAHVPQTIFLQDSSFSENIAFSVDPKYIDFNLLIKSAKQAKIHDFIMSTSQGYDSFVGERGIKISGGQRQRIGIARALYQGASVLIFDEATSALDSRTESNIIDSINMLDKKLTIVMVAHRTSTLSNCDLIIKLNNGFIESKGSPEQMLPK